MIIRIGIYIEIIVVMNGLMLNIFYFDWVIRYGVVIINIVNYDWVGYFVIEVNIINFVSFVYIFKRGVWIDFMIINLFIINDWFFVLVGENMMFDVGMDYCFWFNISFMYVDGFFFEFLY